MKDRLSGTETVLLIVLFLSLGATILVVLLSSGVNLPSASIMTAGSLTIALGILSLVSTRGQLRRSRLSGKVSDALNSPEDLFKLDDDYSRRFLMGLVSVPVPPEALPTMSEADFRVVEVGDGEHYVILRPSSSEFARASNALAEFDPELAETLLAAAEALRRYERLNKDGRQLVSSLYQT